MAAITVASFLAAAQHLARVAPPGALISIPDDFGTLQVTDADGRPVGDVNLALALDRWLAVESSWSTPPGRDLTGPLSIAQPLPAFAPVKLTAVRPPARQITMRAGQRPDGFWRALLGAPEGSMSLWVWACDHKHPDQFGAEECAIAERKRLIAAEVG